MDTELGTGANVLVVALEGDDRNPGTLSRPFRTIQHAARLEGLTVQNARSAAFTVRDSHHVDLYHNKTNKTFSSGIAVWDTGVCFP